MLVPFQDTPVEVEQNTDLPEYLPEDESPSKEQDKAVSRVGSHPEGAASWLSTAANFLSRSFYWWPGIDIEGLYEPTGGRFSIGVVNCQVQFAISYHNKILDYTNVCCVLDFIGHLALWGQSDGWRSQIKDCSFSVPNLPKFSYVLMPHFLKWVHD